MNRTFIFLRAELQANGVFVCVCFFVFNLGAERPHKFIENNHLHYTE